MSKIGLKIGFSSRQVVSKKALYGLLFPFFDPGNEVPWELMSAFMEIINI